MMKTARLLTLLSILEMDAEKGLKNKYDFGMD